VTEYSLELEMELPMQKTWMTWTGRVLSTLVVLLLSFSGIMKLMRPPEVIQSFVGQFGFPESTLLAIGILELACALIYAFPPTRYLGAIVLTGYLGGAIVTHVRVEDVFFGPLILGIVVWAGLWLREPGLRRLIPLVSADAR
jgi:hypothetical protein